MKKHVASPDWERRCHKLIDQKREAWERIDRLDSALRRVRLLFYGAALLATVLATIVVYNAVKGW